MAVTFINSAIIGGNKIIIDHDFLTMQPWADPEVPDGWNKSTTWTAGYFVEENANGMRLYSDGTNISVRQDFLTIGKFYKITCDVYSVADPSITLGNGATSLLTISTPGIHVVGPFEAISEQVSIKRSGASDWVVRSYKIEEVAG
ncbi:MAG: hypothetical protein KAI15_02155 [Gammaproteobacteria bacterium]|nr:hypothetical protein [Gammaproteobacteria bacterium]